MKTKIGLIFGSLVIVAGVVVLSWRHEKPVDVPSGPVGPSFEVTVEKPRVARPLFGILPQKLEDKLEPGGQLRFDHTSPGAESGSVGPNRLELRADGWDLLVEIDGRGQIGPGTRLVYPIELAERHLTLRCRPADAAIGYLRTTVREGSDALDGSFLVELPTCENTATDKVISWPPAALTVRGTFRGLPRRP